LPYDPRGRYWIGLSKDIGSTSLFYWQKQNTKIPEDVNRIRQHRSDQLEKCGYLARFNEILSIEMEECDTKHFSVCQKEALCKPGYFGRDCERRCHCEAEPCGSQQFYLPGGVTCKFGCQTNWTGKACDRELKVPVIKYYCINSAKSGKFVNIRIDTKGVKYNTIYGLTSKKSRGNWCDSTVIDVQDSNLTTIRIPVNNGTTVQMAHGACAGQ
ncbi:unnamed protein product, partial [Candidula unifasciata]